MTLPQTIGPLPNQSGLIALADSVRSYFAQNQIAAEVTKVGLKYRSIWGHSRVVFVPGEFDGSLAPRSLKEGRLGPPEHMKSDNPRELASWPRLVTVCMLAVDESAPTDDEAQIIASDLLFEQTVQAIYNAFTPNLLVPSLGGGTTNNREYGQTGQGSVKFDGNVTRVYPPVELSYGVELLCTFTQWGVLFDRPQPAVTPTFVLNGSFSSPAP